MDSFVIARALHVLAVVHWIGGVWLVTWVILPGLRRKVPAAQRLAMFEMIEGRFGQQARVSTVVAGASGFWMTYQLDGWSRFADPTYWWMHLMVLVWAIFTFVLYVAEPLVLHRWFHARAMANPDAAFLLVERAHRVLFALSAIAVAGAVLGSHGGV